MDKTQLLQELRTALATGTISENDLLPLVHRDSIKPKPNKKRIELSDILYYIGGAIVLLGIGIFVTQHWNELNAVTRIIATLGVSIAATVAAVLFNTNEKTVQVSRVFYLLSGILLPLGLNVVFYEAGYNLQLMGIQTLIAAIASVVYLATFWTNKNTILLAFTVAYFTWLFFVFTSYLLNGSPLLQTWHLTEYRVLAAGMAYIALGYALAPSRFRTLTPLLYTFGLIGGFSAIFSLSGWTPNQNMVWEVLLPGLTLGAILLSTKLRSRVFLVIGSIYLMAYILKITAEYFTDSLGWPLALSIAGLVIMGIGYATFTLNKKYISTQV